jgi:hypothetical protein
VNPPESLLRNLPLPKQVFVIFLSLISAFATDRAWDWWQDRQEEREVLSGLLDEFQGYRSDLESRRAHWDSIRVGMEILFADPDPRGDLTAAQVRDAVRSLVYSSTYAPGSGVRDALIAAGRLEVVRDRDLRRRLVAWDAVLGEVQDNEVVGRELILREIVPLLAGRGVPVGTLESGTATSGLTPAEEAAAWIRVAADPQFLALAGVRHAWLTSSIDEYGEAVLFVDALLERIQPGALQSTGPSADTRSAP